MLLRGDVQFLYLLCLMVVLNACSDESSPVASNESPLRNLSASAIRPSALTMDYEFYQLSDRIPGFAGMYWNRSGEVTIRLKNLQSRARGPAEERATSFALQRSLPFSGSPAFQDAEFTWRELYEWREGLRKPLFSLPGVTSLAIDEVNNRISVGVLNSSQEQRILAETSRLGVPGRAIAIRIREPVRSSAQQLTTESHVRPVAGALKIGNPSKPISCTFSFRSGSHFVTPSHCTKNKGIVDNDKFYQPNSGSTNYLIGTEIMDPSFFNCGLGNDPEDQCRWSDSALAFVQGDIAQGKIYKTFKKSCCPFSQFVFPGAFWLITEEAPWPTQDLLLSMEGFVSGHQQGLVTSTCEDVAWVEEAGGPRVGWLLCQDFIAMDNQDGDSGAPIFLQLGIFTDDVRLYGILQGFSAGETVMSAMNNIEFEVGFLDPTI